MAQVYFSGPWEYILTLRQYLKFYYFKLQKDLRNQSRTPFPNHAGGHQTPPSAAPKLNIQHVVPDDMFKKVTKIW